MKIKVLIENNAADGLSSEHGLCLYIEYREKRYLVDCGASNLFAENAEIMGVDLGKIDMAFLSHAHYDHSGGYERFFDINKKSKVYLQRASMNRQYIKIAGPVKKYIGIPEGMLDKYENRFEYVDGFAKIDDGIYIVPHSSDGILERARHTHMCVMINNKLQYDDFKHEQTVVFEEEDGLVCFNSCSHAGVDIIVEEIKKAFPGKRIKAYIGGFHMMGVTGASSCSYKKEEVQNIAKELLEKTDACFYSGHCTGTIAYEWLKEILEERLVAFQTGKTFDI